MKLNIDFGPISHFRIIDFGRQDHLELSTSGRPEVDGSKWFLGPKSMDPSDFRLRTTEVDAVLKKGYESGWVWKWSLPVNLNTGKV